MAIDPVTLGILGGASLIGGALPSVIDAVRGPPEYMDPTSEEFRRRYGGLRTQIAGPQTGTAFAGAEREAFGAFEGSRGVGAEQASLAEALRAQAEGRGPSLAQMQYQRALEASQAAAASQLASARGLSPAQAQRLLITRQAGAQAAAASQSAQLRLQEQQAAQAALGNLLGQRRQQELLGGQLAAGLYGTAGSLGTQQAISQAEIDQRAKGMVLGYGKEQQEVEQKRSGAIAGAGAAGAEGLFKAMTAARGREMPTREIPGKAKFKGDTRSNDTVPALLSPGEIVLPRSVAQAPDAPQKAMKFVDAIKKQKRPSPKAFAQALARLNELEARLNAMEALADLEAEEEG
jgi:hypothetical protein